MMTYIRDKELMIYLIRGLRFVPILIIGWIKDSIL